MRHYRCTLPLRYPDPTSPGHSDPTARQGYYQNAHVPVDAATDLLHRLNPPGNQATVDVETSDGVHRYACERRRGGWINTYVGRPA